MGGRKLNIVLIGYGKMGKEVEKISDSRGHNIVLKIDVDNYCDFDKINQYSPDVAIEFTNPDSVIRNIRKCFENNIPVVTGTTGWNSFENEIINECRSNNKSMFFASNFSIGVNLFFRLNETLASIMDQQTHYNVQITEIHHTAKLDSPSGTAIRLANQIIDRLDRKQSWKEADKVEDNEIQIIAKRIENVTGTHIINYSSVFDEIEIKHTAKDRRGFAIGAVLAAEFLSGKKGVYRMSDMLKLF